MNTLCKEILQGYKSEIDDKALQELIDAILTYKGEVKDLSENDLKLANGTEVVKGGNDTTPIHDYRIKSLAFKNFRTFFNNILNHFSCLLNYFFISMIDYYFTIIF